jgi:hypothetical protein
MILKTKEIKMEYCNIVLNRDNTVVDTFLFIGENLQKVSEKAEAKFKELAWRYDESMTESDLEIFLENGYVDIGVFGICIVWPEIKEVI